MSEEKLKEGVKFDNEKRRYDLVPADALRQVVDVYTFGARKYEDNNWRKGLKWGRVYGAIQRHLNSFWEGENKDPESGLNHLAHAAWGCLTLLNYCDTKKEFDDRFIVKNNSNKKEILQENEIGTTHTEVEGTVVKEKKDSIQIYLAGTIHATEYRQRFKEQAANWQGKIIVRDPIEEVDSKILLKEENFEGHVKLVEHDKKLIKECDIVVAYVQRYTAGTICEIIYAYENGIPVYLISNDSQVLNDPWIVSHITYCFDSIEDCLNHIDENDLDFKIEGLDDGDINF